MREYNIAIEKRLDVKDAGLLKDLVMVDQWNKMTVVDEDTEFLDKYNQVICDESMPNGEDNIEINYEEK